MRITATERACAIVDRAKAARAGRLTITIGTGCCESTAPFLYEDFWPGPDAEPVGEVAGVEVYAPAYLRSLYPGNDGVIIDVDDGLMAESMSIETEYGCRFVLRGDERVAFERPSEPACDVPDAVSALRSRGLQELPEALRRVRMR